MREIKKDLHWEKVCCCFERSTRNKLLKYKINGSHVHQQLVTLLTYFAKPFIQWCTVRVYDWPKRLPFTLAESLLYCVLCIL